MVEPKRITIIFLIKKYFQTHPNKDIPHDPIVDWVEQEYFKLLKKKPRDTWRSVRKLHQEGFLIRVKKGVHRYDPEYIKENVLFDFPEEIKQIIFKRDDYKCVVCGRGRSNGMEICADHQIPKDRGGSNDIDNGQTLCSEHNIMKKNYSQTEAGKKYFIRIYKQAIKNNDEKMVKFCNEIFDIYDKNEIDNHIKRP